MSALMSAVYKCVFFCCFVWYLAEFIEVTVCCEYTQAVCVYMHSPFFSMLWSSFMSITEK